ncbi:MAG: hypothetical protein AB1742_15265 [bacterium]
MDETERLRLIYERLGERYFLVKAPEVYDYDSRKLQRTAKNAGLFRTLERVYGRIPPVECGDCGDVCCRESPDVYLLEYLYVWRHLNYEAALETRRRVIERSLRWELVFPADEEAFCPFLEDRRCIIYAVRPFNCRVWGLEDEPYYRVKSARARRAMAELERVLSKRGVRFDAPLERRVLPRCERLSVAGDKRYSEEEVLEMDMTIALLHRDLIPPEAFRSHNFHTGFPLHVLLKLYAPADVAKLRVEALKEFMSRGTTSLIGDIYSRLDDLP